MPSSDFWLGTENSKDPDAALYADRAFQYRLAGHLHRTREELLHGSPAHLPISNAEYQEWAAYLSFEVKYQAEQANKKGR